VRLTAARACVTVPHMKLLIISAFLSLAACGGSSPAATSDTSPKKAAGIANPASEYCAEIGGELEIREGEGGQAGVCKKDGAECDEWALFRGECPEMAPGKPDESATTPADGEGDEAAGTDASE
jgi:putative hemolysin